MHVQDGYFSVPTKQFRRRHLVCSHMAQFYWAEGKVGPEEVNLHRSGLLLAEGRIPRESALEEHSQQQLWHPQL